MLVCLDYLTLLPTKQIIFAITAFCKWCSHVYHTTTLYVRVVIIFIDMDGCVSMLHQCSACLPSHLFPKTGIDRIESLLKANFFSAKNVLQQWMDQMRGLVALGCSGQHRMWWCNHWSRIGQTKCRWVDYLYIYDYETFLMHTHIRFDWPQWLPKIHAYQSNAASDRNALSITRTTRPIASVPESVHKTMTFDVVSVPTTTKHGNQIAISWNIVAIVLNKWTQSIQSTARMNTNTCISTIMENARTSNHVETMFSKTFLVECGIGSTASSVYLG